MKKNESGQALILVLLSLSVVLTLILYIISRSVTDVAVSGQQADSVRAFSAAEAGIERALVSGSNISKTGIGDATYTTTVTGFAEGGTDINFLSPVSYGDTVTVWFVSHDENGNLSCNSLPCFHGNDPSIKVCWGNPGTSAGLDTTPAIEFSAYYESIPGNLATIKIGRTAVDPSIAGRQASNSFDGTVGTCLIGGKSYQFQKTIAFSSLVSGTSYQAVNGLQLAQIKMLYNSNTSHEVGVSVIGGNTLPSQGQNITSTGTAGGSNRKISVSSGWAEFPFASNSLLVPSGITQ